MANRSLNKVSWSARFDQGTIDRIREMAEKLGISQAKFIKLAVELAANSNQQENEMSYTLQFTNGAFTSVPESAWKNGKTYQTKKTAFGALWMENKKMQKRCPPNSWDSHYRVVDADGNQVHMTEAENFEWFEYPAMEKCSASKKR